MRIPETHTCQGIGYAGYRRAGHEVTGVDNEPNHAPYHPGRFVLADAATYIEQHVDEYDAVHVSPPCQWYTRGNAGRATSWPRSIPPMREALTKLDKPYIIENVADAAWDMINPTTLCGCMFDLITIDTDGTPIHLKRPRLFETNWQLTAPRPCNHTNTRQWAGVYGGARRDKHEARHIRKGGYVPPDKQTCLNLLGVQARDRYGAPKKIPTWNGLFECLPPAYTEWIGNELTRTFL